MVRFSPSPYLVSFVVMAVAASCAPGMAPFSQRAYEYATELKVDSMKLMDQAESPYGKNAEKVQQLMTEIEKAYEFAKGRPSNEHSTRQWELLISPETNLLGGFLHRWSQKGSLRYPFIAESKKIVADAFDAIIGLESGKIRYDN